MITSHKYKAGTLIAFESGEYSDFLCEALLVSAKDCDIDALAQDFKDTFVSKDDYDEPDPHGFVAWLVVQGHFFPVEYQTLHIGSYGELSIDG